MRVTRTADHARQFSEPKAPLLPATPAFKRSAACACFSYSTNSGFSHRNLWNSALETGGYSPLEYGFATAHAGLLLCVEYGTNWWKLTKFLPIQGENVKVYPADRSAIVTVRRRKIAERSSKTATRGARPSRVRSANPRRTPARREVMLLPKSSHLINRSQERTTRKLKAAPWRGPGSQRWRACARRRWRGCFVLRFLSGLGDGHRDFQDCVASLPVEDPPFAIRHREANLRGDQEGDHRFRRPLGVGPRRSEGCPGTAREGLSPGSRGVIRSIMNTLFFWQILAL